MCSVSVLRSVYLCRLLACLLVPYRPLGWLRNWLLSQKPPKQQREALEIRPLFITLLPEERLVAIAQH